MFRHGGRARTFKQDLRLASFLSFTAGIVNTSGLLAVDVLTTNVTGHFAYFSQAMQRHQFLFAFNYLFYILFFLAGAFTSTMLVEYYIMKGKAFVHNTAIFLEIGLLVLMGLGGARFARTEIHKEMLACLLLFTMGLQNALVTRVSNAKVRTTHLTGLFTDLGIDMSQLFFYKEKAQQQRLKKSIGLRGVIIAFFFLGCIAGGYFFQFLLYKTLLIAVAALIVALIYDNIRVTLYRFFKKIRSSF